MEMLISIAASAAVTWFFSWLYYRRQRHETEPMRALMTEIREKLASGAFTKDEAAREVIKALETGALKGEEVMSSDPFWPYRFCPDCGAGVQKTDMYDTPDGGGYTLRCTKCKWNRELYI